MLENFSDGVWFISSLVGVVLILLLTYYGSRWLVKRVSNVSGTRNIKVIDRAMLGQDKYVAIVRIGKKNMLLGVTSHNINKLADLEEDDVTEVELPEDILSESFKELYQKSVGSISKKVGRKSNIDDV